MSKEDVKELKKRRPPARTPEARENQLIAAAVDLAEKQILAGTASSQVITHYLKIGSTKEKIEKEILESQRELIQAKTDQLRSAKKQDELYSKALKAMKKYTGGNEEEDDGEE
jgi:hypothetical protein